MIGARDGISQALPGEDYNLAGLMMMVSSSLV